VYLFARFEWQHCLRQEQAARGVSGVVHFGERWPVIEAEIIENLRAAIGQEELHTLAAELAPGDTLEIADGAMRGLSAVITRVLPSRERVVVLMDFLRRQTTIEVPVISILKEGEVRTTGFSPPGKSPARRA
jgi:transcription antitermination factor NusG